MVKRVWERLGAAGVPRTAHSYNVLMHACNCAGQWETTVAQWEALQAAEVAPDVRTYTCVIRALGQIGEPQLALKAFTEMKARGIVPDMQCVNTTMVACKELDMLAEILS
jgi:pentatricopeptide repeat domain-containing protein 1